jgi:hypothetical protein
LYSVFLFETGSVIGAPNSAVISRVDEVTAARTPVLKWSGVEKN